ncbi:FxSxx-COOH system tetratricopeptide repeat protein [Saccharopolyspora indica]|uniref:FxSxx-COOH system tetratricopeptide repeat protein n=1 Tax=Saccharopolyspora indica TaxID=1229659 RepID=UPI0022EB41C6|nr:FxSxx-COOH system tetratricopeptide repeat protein [Saccharopolyspora indica]MDA3642788.1 FxSxx-COOH system tetratricopeptide repeat protein [Saccharopolyspora indica]
MRRADGGAAAGPDGRAEPATAPLLSAGELDWSEVADAVWLTAATQHAWGRKRGAAPQDPADESPQWTDERPAVAETEPREEPPEPPEPLPRPPEEVDQDVVADVLPDEEWSVRDGVPADGAGLRVVRREVGRPDFVRALRPFKREISSPHDEDALLDEDATAERAVEDGLWLPMTRPGKTRWLDLTLVVDTNPSMALWSSTISGFLSALERLGAFRSIQRRLLETGATPSLRGGTPDTPVRSPAELIDPSGRRVVLVLTDGVAACWRRGSVAPLLATWGESMSVAVAHLFPQRLWHRGGLRPQRAKLTTPRAAAPNRQWQVELPDAWLDPDPSPPPGSVAVPILELETRWLSHWAQLVAGQRRRSAEAVVMLAGPLQPAEDEAQVPGNGRARSPQQRVMNFLSTASPPASRLATLLAAVPVSVPVARAIQTELVPGSGPDDLAEVFTSDLLRPVDEAGGWENATFAFEQPVREVLLSGARRSETAHVLRIVADRVPGVAHLRDALADPDRTPSPLPAPDSAGDLEIERAVMRALSGPYLARAGRIGRQLRGTAKITRSAERDRFSSGTGGSDESVSTADTTASGKMSGHNSEPASAQQHPDRLPEPLRVVPFEPAEGASDTSGPPSTVVARILRERRSDDVPPIWGDVPPRNPIFTGREEPLAELDERLKDGGTTAILPSALHGMSGIGKTQIAVEYVYRHLSDYDLVWWVQAGQAAQIRAGLTELAQALQLPGSSEAHTAVPAVREALRRGYPIRRWLLVFDAAESPEDVRPFFPANGPGEIIITSRNPDWAEVAGPLEVTLFERSESKALLRSRGPEITEDEADALAEKLGDLPLAIAQAAAWRAETGMPVSEYLRVFDEKVAEILDVSAPNDYEVSLAAAWNVSLDQLEARNPAAHQLLQVCAFFAAEPISRSLFTGVRGTAVSPELDAALRDPLRLGRAIRDINRFGLAKIDHRNDTLQLHRLVQLVLRDRMSPQRRAEVRHGAHLLLANLDPGDPADPAQWPRFQAILPHAYASNVLECEDPWVRQLVIDLMEYLFFWGDHHESAALGRRAMQAWSTQLEETDPQLMQVAAKLGPHLTILGRFEEAAELNGRMLALRKQTSGENSEETLDAELSVAFDLKAKGEYSQARDMNLATYQKAKALYGEDDPVTLSAVHDFAVTLRLLGDYRGARELNEDTVRRRGEVHGYDSAHAVNTLGGLILDRLELGDYIWAHAEMERLFARCRKLFGEDKAITLYCQHRLAVAARKNGDHRGAFELSSGALDLFRFRYGSDHPNTLACAISHSIDLRHYGDLANARKLGEDTYDRYRRGLGENHPHTLGAAIDVAVTLRALGEVDGARQLDEGSVEQLGAIFGPEQAHSVISVINLASDLAALGENEAALELSTETAQRAGRVFGPDHPTTIAATHNLVLDLRTAGRGEEAELKHADVLSRYREVLGERHPAVMAAVRGDRADCDIDPVPL